MSSSKIIVMAKSVADQWIKTSNDTEYRFSVVGFDSLKNSERMASTIRAWRDGRYRIASVPSIKDVSVRNNGGRLEVWSSNHETLKKLASWFESMGLDTDYIL